MVMMNKEQIIDEAYENYSKEYEKDNSIGLCLLVDNLDGRTTYRKPNKEMFVDLCTHDKTFSERWGLKIEERELSEGERVNLFMQGKKVERFLEKITNKDLDGSNRPTKLITITYNNETIESYE
jgi:hypothetical protein